MGFLQRIRLLVRSRLYKYRGRLLEAAAGVTLQDTMYWEVSGTRNAATFLRGLPVLFPETAYVCFEGTTERRFSTWLSAHAIQAPLKIAAGTIWPRSDWFHVPLRSDLMEVAAKLADKHRITTPSIHIYVHDGTRVLLQWHDAFCEYPIFVSGTFSEGAVAKFADAIGAQGFDKNEADIR